MEKGSARTGHLYSAFMYDTDSQLNSSILVLPLASAYSCHPRYFTNIIQIYLMTT